MYYLYIRYVFICLPKCQLLKIRGPVNFPFWDGVQGSVVMKWRGIFSSKVTDGENLGICKDVEGYSWQDGLGGKMHMSVTKLRAVPRRSECDRNCWTFSISIHTIKCYSCKKIYIPCPILCLRNLVRRVR